MRLPNAYRVHGPLPAIRYTACPQAPPRYSARTPSPFKAPGGPYSAARALQATQSRLSRPASQEGPKSGVPGPVASPPPSPAASCVFRHTVWHSTVGHACSAGTGSRTRGKSTAVWAPAPARAAVASNRPGSRPRHTSVVDHAGAQTILGTQGNAAEPGAQSAPGGCDTTRRSYRPKSRTGSPAARWACRSSGSVDPLAHRLTPAARARTTPPEVGPGAVRSVRTRIAPRNPHTRDDNCAGAFHNGKGARRGPGAC